jgi:hypothetical protein
MSRTVCPNLTALVLLVLATAPAAAQQTSATLTTGTVAVRLRRVNTFPGGASANPLYGATAPGDGRLFVVQQGTTDTDPDTPGRIRYFNPGVIDGAVGTLVDWSVALPGVLDARHFEKGLLGLAFHPGFNDIASPGYLKFYTYSNELVTAHGTPTFVHPELGANPTNSAYNVATLREWTANSPTPTGVTGASRVVLTILDPQNQHNGGTIAFSPVDGYLYWALGDGGGNSSTSPDFVGAINSPTDGHTNSTGPGVPHGNGQDRTNPFGDMLRINPLPAAIAPDPDAAPSANGQYQIPLSNPFTMQSNINPKTALPYPDWNPAWLDEIYAYGLRNPYRFSFDRGAAVDDSTRGTLYLNDPGWDDREELNIITPGANYGWVIREGTDDMAGDVGIPIYTPPVNAHTGLPDVLVDPIAEYDDSVGTATIGGFVYRGWKESALYGKYIFGDNNATLAGVDGLLMYIDPQEAKAPGAPFTIRRLAISPLGASVPAAGLLGFGEGADGLIYAMFDNGQIYALNPLFAADFDDDGDVDAADLTVWRRAVDATADGDADADGDSDAQDFLVWQRQLGSGIGSPPFGQAVPEPTARSLLAIVLSASLAAGRAAAYR